MSAARCLCAGERCKLTADDPRHGSHNGYGNYLCRCEPCRAAYARRQYEYKKALRSRGIPPHVHATINGYTNYGCRCGRCLEVFAEYERDRRRRNKEGSTDVTVGRFPAPKWRFEDRPHTRRTA